MVADLTDRNANVFWELGVRQSFKQGTLTIAEAGTAIPFDISTKSTLFYCPHDHIKMANFRQAFKNAIQDCLINPGATDSRVLEILGGRGTLFEIFRRDDTIRRIDALLSELKRNLDQIDYELKEKAQATTKEKALPSVTLFHSSALELLVAERYIDVSSETYDLFEHLLYMLLMLNRFMSGSVIEDIALKVFSKTKTYIEKCITEIKNYREKINNRL